MVPYEMGLVDLELEAITLEKMAGGEGGWRRAPPPRLANTNSRLAKKWEQPQQPLTSTGRAPNDDHIPS